MINIELHGMEQKEAKNLKEKIFEMIWEKFPEPIARNVVISTLNTIIEDVYGLKKQRFRIITPSHDKTGKKIVAMIEKMIADNFEEYYIEWIQCEFRSPFYPDPEGV
ncbi:hypothetical protein KAS79_01210 [Candidatus Parcubacteria bacterium]|nr:hypothetical protein [Candidatus Parcubacteria bacterium]